MTWNEALGPILFMALVTYLIRALPLVFFRKKVENPYVKAFLAYVPYAVLAALTVPDILSSTPSLASAIAGTIAAVWAAWKGRSLLFVAAAAAIAALLVQLIL
jgi:branched-subunit amino acid transport protein